MPFQSCCSSQGESLVFVHHWLGCVRAKMLELIKNCAMVTLEMKHILDSFIIHPSYLPIIAHYLFVCINQRLIGWFWLVGVDCGALLAIVA